MRTIIARFEFGHLCATIATAADAPGITLMAVRRADGSEWKEAYPAPPPSSAGDCISMLALALSVAEREAPKTGRVPE